MIDANKDSNTSHNTGPLLLVTSLLSQNVIEIWIQEANYSYATNNHNFTIPHTAADAYFTHCADDIFIHNITTTFNIFLFFQHKLNKERTYPHNDQPEH